MLAEAEAAAGLDVGIAATLDDRLEQGPIPVMEVNLRAQTIQTDIAKLDAGGFAAHFTKVHRINGVLCRSEAGRSPGTDIQSDGPAKRASAGAG